MSGTLAFLLAQTDLVNLVSNWAIGGIIIAGIVAVLLVALGAMNVHPPAWLVKIGWYVVIVVVAVLAVLLIRAVALRLI